MRSAAPAGSKPFSHSPTPKGRSRDALGCSQRVSISIASLSLQELPRERPRLIEIRRDRPAGIEIGLKHLQRRIVEPAEPGVTDVEALSGLDDVPGRSLVRR